METGFSHSIFDSVHGVAQPGRTTPTNLESLHTSQLAYPAFMAKRKAVPASPPEVATTSRSASSSDKSTRLSRRDYSVNSESFAVTLLGCRLVRILDNGTRLSGIIVETEAYTGVDDLASHAVGGRRTPRNESMYAQAGTAYVYFTYGMHFCMNIVCGKVDEPVAVLLRALEPVDGIEHMIQLRNAGRTLKKPITEAQLCNGPGKLCQALAIDRALNGVDLVTNDQLFIERPSTAAKRRLIAPGIVNATRIGISGAGDWTHAPLRWYIKDNRHVSVK
jgi:DNA-3-methyladenine glycosylase